MLADTLSRYWWTTLLRGIAWVLFGIVVFTRPGMTLLTLTLLFGGFVLVDGAALVVSAVGGRSQERWWVLMLAGLTGIGAGLLTFFNPAITAIALLFCIGTWAIVAGVLEVVAAIRLRKEISGEFWLVLVGLISIAFGASLLLRPLQGALSVLFVIGCYAFVLGATLIVLAFRARGFLHRAIPAIR